MNKTNLIEAVLASIHRELTRIMESYYEDFASPFLNSGNSYSNDTFQVQAYRWDTPNIWNFKWRDIEIKWYKNFGRGLEVKDLSFEEINDMLNDCLQSLEKEETKLETQEQERINCVSDTES